MKNLLNAFGTTSGALALFVLVGCGGGGGGKKDLSPSPDLSGGDMSGAVTCSSAPWPSNDTVFLGVPDPISGVDFLTAGYEQRPNAMSSSLIDQLGAEVWDMTSAPGTYPTTFTFASTDKYNTCTGCVGIWIGRDPTDSLDTPGTFYFAQSGSMTVTKADRDPGMGNFSATGSNVHLVEWSYFDSAASDSAIPGGGCFDIASFSMSGTYTNSLDGGTD